MLNEDELREAVLLIFANKQVSSSPPVSEGSEVIDRFQLSEYSRVRRERVHWSYRPEFMLPALSLPLFLLSSSFLLPSSFPPNIPFLLIFSSSYLPSILSSSLPVFPPSLPPSPLPLSSLLPPFLLPLSCSILLSLPLTTRPRLFVSSSHIPLFLSPSSPPPLHLPPSSLLLHPFSPSLLLFPLTLLSLPPIASSYPPSVRPSLPPAFRIFHKR